MTELSCLKVTTPASLSSTEISPGKIPLALLHRNDEQEIRIYSRTIQSLDQGKDVRLVARTHILHKIILAAPRKKSCKPIPDSNHQSLANTLNFSLAEAVT